MASGSNAPFSGDHRDLENVKDGQHHAAATPDGSTIIRDSNGEIKAVNETTVFGDFESNKGAWSEYGTVSSSLSTSNGGAQGTSQYFRLKQNSDFNEGGIERNIDLSDIDTLVVYYKFDPLENGTNGSSSESFDVIIDGTNEFSDNPDGISTDWIRVEIDVSSYSGTNNVQLNLSMFKDPVELGVDRIRTKKTIGLNVSSNSAGGV